LIKWIEVFCGSEAAAKYLNPFKYLWSFVSTSYTMMKSLYHFFNKWKIQRASLPAESTQE